VVGEEVLVGGGEHPLRAEFQCRCFFLQCAREDGHLGAHGRGDLHTHVAESAESEHGDLLGSTVLLLTGAPAVERRIGGDARAQQRGGDVEVQRIGDPADEAFVDDDLLRVSALGDRAVDVFDVVRADVAVQAVLLLTGQAFLALAARIHHAAHAHAVADLPVGDIGADGLDDAGDLVADGEREVRLAPFVADGVDVAVADAGRLDVDEDVIGSRIPAFDRGHAERLVRSGLLQCLDADAHMLSLDLRIRCWATSSSACGSQSIPCTWTYSS
jgi:hypothetical protein